MKRVWVAGEVLIDLIPNSEGRPIPIVGGGGANTAKASALLGLDTFFIDGISNDDFGVMARKELSDSGVRLDYANPSSNPTATAKVTLDSRGTASYTFALEGTATFDFHQSWLPKGNPDVLHYGTLSTVLAPGSDELFAWASSITAAKVFDPNIRPSVLADKNLYRDSVEQWLAISDVVKFSSDDMNWLYSLDGTESSLVDMAKNILEQGPSIIVITFGADGILGITRDQTLKVPSVPVAVVDTVGAGDTVGAIIVEAIAHFGLSRFIEEKLDQTLSRAAKAAAITCSRAGAQPPSPAELGEVSRSYL